MLCSCRMSAIRSDRRFDSSSLATYMQPFPPPQDLHATNSCKAWSTQCTDDHARSRQREQTSMTFSRFLDSDSGNGLDPASGKTVASGHHSYPLRHVLTACCEQLVVLTACRKEAKASCPYHSAPTVLEHTKTQQSLCTSTSEDDYFI